jgi:PBSX family phage terminase large subunit
MQLLTWWTEKSPYRKHNGIIADGSIRAGKTVAMAISFVLWAMDTYDGQNFAMCGKTVGSFRRNVWSWLKPVLMIRRFIIEESRTENLIVISKGDKTNYFYVFGGRDESSQDLIQGITLAGLYCDEVALMPESFVNQATGRCSVPGSKMWFNCNPDSPMHWFLKNWIEKADQKKLLFIHFLMDDNPSLTEEVRERYRTTYTGVFYQRFIQGLWVTAQGAIYRDAWSDDLLFGDEKLDWIYKNAHIMRRFLAIDYGTVNPMVYLDIWDDGQDIWVTDEYYWDSRADGNYEKDNSQYADDLLGFIHKCPVDIWPTATIIDPSAASFKIELRNRGLRMKETVETINADNSVIEGIRCVNTLLTRRRIHIHKRCVNTIKEHQSYAWDNKAIEAGGRERPLKVNDHSCVVGDTLVSTPDGLVPIKDLKNKKCYALDLKTREVTVDDVLACEKTGENKDVFAVELEDGHVIKATADHPFLTQRGWVKLSDLTPEDELVYSEDLS